MFRILFTDKSEIQLAALEKDLSLKKRYKAVRKAIAYLETNPKHPSLKTHKYHNLEGSGGEEIFEAYAENNTPSAYRIFWHYGPGKNVITIVAIISHP